MVDSPSTAPLTSKDALRKVVELLQEMLYNERDKRCLGVRRTRKSSLRKVEQDRQWMYYSAIPFSSTEALAGVPLIDLFIPRVDLSGKDLMHIFEAWVYDPLGEFDKTYYGDAPKTRHLPLWEFVRAYADTDVQTIRLLVALSRSPGSTSTWDATSFMVENEGCEFGIKEGRLVTRFSQDHPIPINILKEMTKKEQRICKSPDFCSLFRDVGGMRSKVRDTLLNALAALVMRRPFFDFSLLKDDPGNYPVGVVWKP